MNSPLKPQDSSLGIRMLRSTLTSHLVWFPAALGTAVGLLADPPIAYLGWGAVGFGVASLIWKLTLGSRQLTDHAKSKQRGDANREHRAYLRQLQQKLRTDRDPRTGEMLRKLRDLYGRLDDISADPELQRPWQIEVVEQIQDLYQSSLSALERSFEIWERSRDMATDETRQQLMNWRADVLGEVDHSIQQLNKTADQVQASALKRELPEDDLAQMRQELEQGLTVARNVEQQIENLENELKTNQSPLREES